MKKLLIIFVVGLAAYIGYISHQHSKAAKRGEKSRNEQTQRENETRQIALDLAKKHNAVTDWLKELDDKATIWEDFSVEDFYSLQVERALTKNKQQPVLIIGELQDVKKEGDKYYAVFAGQFPSRAQYLMEIDSAQTAELLKYPRDYSRYAIVCKIHSARIPTVKIRGAAESGSLFQDDVRIETVTDYYLITGRAIEFKCLDRESTKRDL